VIDWGLPADQAIALPNIFYGGDGLMVERGTTLAAMIPALARFGQPVVAADLPSKLTILQRDGDGWKGAADPRSEGVALAQ
jgi:gamma-glutamyltranspeptidase/glutathione hydrolase